MQACSSCGSNNLIQERRGTNLANGVLASSVFGPLGFLAANAGSENVIVICTDCHSQFEFTPSQPKPTSALHDLKKAAVFFSVVAAIGFLVRIFT